MKKEDYESREKYEPEKVEASAVERLVIRQTGAYCVSEIPAYSEDEAWELFIDKYKHLCTWWRGNKYWRVKPQLDSRVDFETTKKEYKVYARMMLFLDDEPCEIEEANFDYKGKRYSWRDYSV